MLNKRTILISVCLLLVIALMATVFLLTRPEVSVGDKTIMFRLCDQEMYWSMAKDRDSLVIDRGMRSEEHTSELQSH